MRAATSSSIRSVASLGLAAAIVLAVSGMPTAAQTADVTLENVRIGFGEIAYAAPRMVVRGTPLSRTEWTALLDPNGTEPLAARTRRMEAASIELPEVVAEVKAPTGLQRTTYRDVRFESVKDGRIASVTAAAGTIEMPQPSGTGARGSFGRMSVGDIDLARAVGLFYEKGRPGDALQPIQGRFSLDGLTIDDGRGVTFRIGRMAGDGFSARPTTTGWLGTINLLAATPDLKAAPPEARARSVEALREIFASIGFGAIEASDVAFSTAQDGGASGTAGRIAMAGALGTRPAELKVERFEAGSPGKGRVKFASLTFGGLSIQPVLDMMRDQDATSGPPAGPEAIRRLFAMVASVQLAGLEIDLSDGAAKAASAPEDGPGAARGARIGLGGFEFATGKPVDGLPSELRIAVSRISFPIPANSGDKAMSEIASLGYERMDASFSGNIGWNEAGQELVLRELSLEGVDAGRVALRGIVGHVTRDAFNADTAVASVALLGASAKSAELSVENRGLFERVVAREARRQKRAPEDVRREYGMAAAVGIPAMLGNSAGAKTLAQAVARFVAKPGRLTITARAKAPAGFGAADFAAAPDPASVLNALEITASAE